MVNNTETYLVEGALALPASPFSRSCPGRRNRRLCGLCVVRLPLCVGIADANAVARAGDGDASEQGMGQQQRAAKEQKPNVGPYMRHFSHGQPTVKRPIRRMLTTVIGSCFS